MKISGLLPGFIWLPTRYSVRNVYQQKLDRQIKNHFSYVENKQNNQRGYLRGEFGNSSALALYISRYLGDGIYYSDNADILELLIGTPDVSQSDSDAVYFLVISDGKVMAGTDIIVSVDLFDFLVEQISGPECSDLNIREFTKENLDELNRKYMNDVVSEKKQSNIMIGLVLMVLLILCGGGLAWFILMA